MDIETVLLERYNSAIDAEIARGILESSDIECFIANQLMAGFYVYATPIISFDLFVKKDSAELASEILNAKFVTVERENYTEELPKRNKILSIFYICLVVILFLFTL